MYCEKCGQKQEDDAKFCDNCGAKMIPFPGKKSDMQEVNAQTADVQAVNTQTAKPENDIIPEGKKKSGVLVVVLSLLVVVLVTVIVIIGIVFFRGKDSSSGKTQKTPEAEFAAREAEKESMETTAEVSEEETATAVPLEDSTSPLETQETKAAETAAPEEERPEKMLERVSAVSSRDLTSGADFITASRPDGAYSFMYPTEYFYMGTYNEQSKNYYLATADSGIIVEFYEIDAPIPGDPHESAGKMYEALKGEFLEEEPPEGTACPYVRPSKGVADDGYSRMIIGGPLAANTSWAAYYCTASNSVSTYVMKIQYAPADHKGIGVDHTRTGYLVDCLYRGWSLSGSTYKLRSYEQYMSDDMGEKKAGES